MPSPFAWEDEDLDPLLPYPPPKRRSLLRPEPSPYDGEDLDDDEDGLSVTSFSVPRPLSEEYGHPDFATAQPRVATAPVGERLFDPEEGPPPDQPGIPRKPRTALEDLAAHQGSMPQQQAPKWWQRVAAGALGGAAGYLNAGGRNRIDVAPAVAGIYAGDYPRQMGNWKNEQAALTTRAKIEGQQIEETRRKEESVARISRDRAAETRANRIPSERPFEHDPAKEMGVIDSTAPGGVRIVRPAVAKPPDLVEIEPEIAIKSGVQPSPDGKYYVPKASVSALVRAAVTPAKSEPPERFGTAVPYPADVEAQRARMAGATASARQSGGGLVPTSDPNAPATIDDVPASIRPQVNAVLRYQAGLPPQSRANPQNAAIRYWTFRLDKNYSEEQYPTRRATAVAYATGKPAIEMNAMNTVLGHVGALEESGEALKNGNVRILNAVANRLGVEVGKSPVVTFNTIVHRVGPELIRAYVGAGGDEGERREAGADFSDKNSPDQIMGAARVTAKLLSSKIAASLFNYHRSMSFKPDDPRGQELVERFFTPEARNVMDRLVGPGWQTGNLSLSDGGSSGKREQHSASTGQYRHSLDGGKTWQPGRLPK